MHVYQQNSPEWLDMRRNKIGASDAPVIMGVSPWKTPYQLWEEKLGFSGDRAQSRAMDRGNALEETARMCFEKETGLIVVPQVVQHPDYEWMIASLDGIDFASKNIVEIKCPGKVDHQCALDGEVPSKYMPQMQHQLEVTGLNKGYYYSFDGQNGKVIEVYRDQNYIDSLLDREMAFWGCMVNLESPKLTDRDYIVKDDELWSAAASSWLKIHRELEELKAKEEELRESLICLSGKNNVKGAGVRLSKIIRKGAVDYKKIPEIRDVDLEAYRKSPIESWRIIANG